MTPTHEYAGLSPATGWFYVATGGGDELPTIFPVAVWAVTRAGDVIGLISASGAETDGHVARLVAAPPTGGRYLQEAQLTHAQLERMKKG